MNATGGPGIFLVSSSCFLKLEKWSIYPGIDPDFVYLFASPKLPFVPIQAYSACSDSVSDEYSHQSETCRSSVVTLNKHDRVGTDEAAKTGKICVTLPDPIETYAARRPTTYQVRRAMPFGLDERP